MVTITSCDYFSFFRISQALTLYCFFRTIKAVNHFDLEPYIEIKEWFETVKGEIPHYEECNGKGAGDMGLWYRTVTGKGNFISDVNLG